MTLISVFLKRNDVGFHVALSPHLWWYSTSNSGLSPSTLISKQDTRLCTLTKKTTRKKLLPVFYCSLPYYLETRSLSELDTVLVLLTSPKDPRINLSSPSAPNARVIGTHSYVGLFTLHAFWRLKSSSHVYTVPISVRNLPSQSQEISLGFFF